MCRIIAILIDVVHTLVSEGVLYILFKTLGKNLKECLLSTGWALVNYAMFIDNLILKED